MDRPATAARVLGVALGVGLGAELLLDGHQPGINVLLATMLLLAATIAIAGGVRRIDRLDAWIPPTALVLASFAAVRDDGPLVLLDVVGAMGLSAASAPAFAGLSVTRRATSAIVDLAARVLVSTIGGAVPLLERVRDESDTRVVLAKQGGRAVPVLRGLVIVVPMLIVFSALFSAADPIFGRWMDRLTMLNLDLGELPWRMGFTAVATWFAAGLLWFVWIGQPAREPQSLGAAAADPGAPAVPWPAEPSPPMGSMRLGAIEALTVLVALDILFASFVGLQLAYLFGGADTLPAIGMSYANYARRGFFELLVVVGLVGGLVLGLEAVVAQRSRRYVLALLALVGLTGVVLASSFTRLALYQEAYGWTELRFYVLAAIVFFAMCLVAATVLILRDRSQWLPHAIAASSLVVLVAVNGVGPQATITDRNLERALVPSVVPSYGEETLDAFYLGSLSADAVPALVAALPSLPEAERGQLLPLLERAWRRYVVARDDSWQAANLARERARAALEGLFGPGAR